MAILMLGIALSAIVGGPIPLIIAGVAAVVFAIVANWGGIKDWVEQNVCGPLRENFGGLGDWIADRIEDVMGFFDNLGTYLGDAVKWFRDKFDWLMDFLGVSSSDAGDDVKRNAKDSVGGIQGVWRPVSNWFSTIVGGPVGRVFGDIGRTIKDKFTPSGIKSSFSGLSNWFSTNVTGPISRLFSGISFRIPHIPTPHFNWSWTHLKVGEVTVASLPNIWVDWYAKGGLPDVGDLFVANERGPEMVGTMGGKNAVANQQEIIAGIEGGVFRAMSAAIASNRGSGSEDRGEGGVIVLRIGNEEVARANYEGTKSLRRRGVAVELG